MALGPDRAYRPIGKYWNKPLSRPVLGSLFLMEYCQFLYNFQLISN